MVQHTQSLHRSRGIHNVHDEIVWQDHPDLVEHDSGGFEAGTDDGKTHKQDVEGRKQADQFDYAISQSSERLSRSYKRGQLPRTF